MADTYHHGDLRAAVLQRALEVIGAEGPQAVTLRALAADLGVSHTAPRHHFGDLRGVLTAIATEGYDELATRQAAVHDGGGSFQDVGVAYVEFALEHRAHFAVMFAPHLLDTDDPELRRAKRRSFDLLRGGVDEMAQAGQVDDAAAAVIAGWGLVHGIATLALAGNLDDAKLRELVDDGDIPAIARRATGMLYGSPD